MTVKRLEDQRFSGNAASNVLEPDSTAGGKTLAVLKGSALLDDLRYVILTVLSGTVYWSFGDADTDSMYLGVGEVWGRPLAKAVADTIKLYSESDTPKVGMEEYD